MVVEHKDIMDSIESKNIRDRKDWEHLFILKHKFQGSVRRYLLSMGDFKEERKDNEYIIAIPFLTLEVAKKNAIDIDFESKIICKEYPWYSEQDDEKLGLGEKQ